MKMGEKVMGSITETAHMASFATPEVRGLFDEWSRTVEEEILDFVKSKGSATPSDIAAHLKITERSVVFFISRMAGEGKLRIPEVRS
jgi:hypothetical protein